MRQITIENTEVFSLEELKMGKELQESLKHLPLNDLYKVENKITAVTDAVSELKAYSFYLMQPKIEDQKALDLAEGMEDVYTLLTKKIAVQQLIEQKQTEEIINAL